MSSSHVYFRHFSNGGATGARRLVASALVAVTVPLFSAIAPAQLPAIPNLPEQVQLQYGGGAGCPSQAAFVNEVGARIRRPIEWVASQPTTLIVVTLQQTDDHATGRLEVTRHAAEPTRREFIAGSCGEVGSALALVTALTLDPNARTEPLSPLGRDAPSEPLPTPVTVTPPPAPPRAPTPPAPNPFNRTAPPPLENPRVPAVGAWLGPVAGVSLGYAPQPLITMGLSLGARRRGPGLSPSLQLTPLWGKTGTTGPTARGASFSWAMARLEACPTELELAAPLALAVCAAGEVGQLSARGTAVDILPVTASRSWLAAGVTAALHFRRGSWFARLGAQALFPAIRDEFVFHEPDQSIHRASALVFGATLGVGVELGP
jgi:hypothetical protein